MNTPRDTELVTLRKQAERWATERRESVTSAHLLAAVAQAPGVASDLLGERGLDTQGLLKAARSASDDERDPVRAAIQRAREVATHMRSPEPSALHLLLALLGARRCAGYRVLDQYGIDVGRLRVAAMNAGLERLGRRRIPTRRGERADVALGTTALPAASQSNRSGGAITVPLTPKPTSITRRSSGPRGSFDVGSFDSGSLGTSSEDSASHGGASDDRASDDRASDDRASDDRASGSGKRSRSVPSQPTQSDGATAPKGGSAAISSAELEHHASSATDPRVDSSAASSPTRPTKRGRKRANKSPFALDARRFKLLSALGSNLTEAAFRGQLEPVVGRELESQQVLDVLAKREGNNPCLVGPAGVGKTSIVRAVAQLIVDSCSREAGSNALDDRVIIEVSAANLLAGTGVRGALAQRIADIKKEVEASDGRVVLFFDEIHQLFSSDSGDELVGELKRAWSMGQLPCIGVTGPEQYQRCFEADPTLLRRFSRIDVEEPSPREARAILDELGNRFAEHHGVEFDAAALDKVVDWSSRYLSGRALPDKAISIVDLAGARARRRGVRSVDAAQVAEIVSETAQVPKERLMESDGERLLRLEETLACRVVGHAGALQSMSRIIRRNAAGLGGSRPIGTFLLLGPTGVGKTETAKAIAQALFGTEQALTRIDLSEFSEAHAVARLIGAPPGYVGFEAGGQLTESVRSRPYQVLLLDEIEKAHSEVLETFLPLFDEGRLTDGRGRTVDFTNTVIVLTSNIGAREALGNDERRLGFGQRQLSSPKTSQSAVQKRVIAAAKERLSPEFFNRLDEVMVFEGLKRKDVEEIATRLLSALAKTVYDQRQVELRFEQSVVQLLLEQGGFDPELGARPMKRAIARLIEAPLAEAMLAGQFTSGDHVALRARDGQIHLRVDPPEASRQLSETTAAE